MRGGEALLNPGPPFLAPMGEVGGVEPFLAQEGADSAGGCDGVGLGEDPELVGGGEGAALGAGPYFGVGGGSGAGRV